VDQGGTVAGGGGGRHRGLLPRGSGGSLRTTGRKTGGGAMGKGGGRGERSGIRRPRAATARPAGRATRKGAGCIRTDPRGAGAARAGGPGPRPFVLFRKSRPAGDRGDPRGGARCPQDAPLAGPEPTKSHSGTGS